MSSLSQCILCNDIDDESYFIDCQTCPRSFCILCINAEKKLKSPIMTHDKKCIWCRIQ